jgi:hypothetical protein
MVGQHLLEPFRAHEDGVARAEDILDGVVDHGHQRDDGAEGHDDKNRQHQKPGLVVFPFFHGAPPFI